MRLNIGDVKLKTISSQYQFLLLVKVVKFNHAKQLPDAFCQKVVYGFSTDMYTPPDIGFRYSGFLSLCIFENHLTIFRVKTIIKLCSTRLITS